MFPKAIPPDAPIRKMKVALHDDSTGRYVDLRDASATYSTVAVRCRFSSSQSMR